MKPATNNQKPETAAKPRVPFAQFIHTKVFILAPRVHPECHGSAELLDAIRADIVRLEIGSKPSLSSVGVAGKVNLVNAYLRQLGIHKAYHVPREHRATPAARSHRPANRTAPPNPDALPTVAQREQMARLFNELHYPGEGERQAFCERTCGRRIPATVAQAGKIINGLKAMQKRGYRWGQPGLVTELVD